MTKVKNETDWQFFVLLLKEIATTKGIDHEDIANKTGLKRPNVTRFFALNHKPNLDIFLQVAKAIGVYFFLEDKEQKSDLSICFNRAMDKLGRNPEKLNKN